MKRKAPRCPRIPTGRCRLCGALGSEIRAEERCRHCGECSINHDYISGGDMDLSLRWRCKGTHLEQGFQSGDTLHRITWWRMAPLSESLPR
jgi:hypothetical protein